MHPFVLNTPGAWPIALGGGVALVAATWWLYRRQTRALALGWRLLLPFIRSLAMVTLAAALLEPALRRPKTMAERGVVIVLIDNSPSMGVVDQRSPHELVALADALGRLPAGVRPVALTSIRADLDAAQIQFTELMKSLGDLDYARLSGRDLPSARARVNQQSAALGVGLRRLADRAGDFDPPRRSDSSTRALRRALKELETAAGELPEANASTRRERRAALERRLGALTNAIETYESAADARLYNSNSSVRATCDALAKLTRLQLAQAALTSDTGLLESFGPQTPVIAWAFSDDAQPLGAIGPPSAPDAEADQVLISKLTPSGFGTDLTAALAKAAEHLGGRAVRAVIILSDGRQVGVAGAASAALPSIDAPIYAISPTVESAPLDWSFTRVMAPDSALVGETIRVQASVRGSPAALAAMQPSSAAPAVTLRLGDGDSVQPSVVTRHSDGEDVEFDFPVGAGTAPVLQATLEFAHVSGDVCAANDRAQRWIKIAAHPLRVAAISGGPNWDFTYLSNALGRTNWVDLTSTLLGPSGVAAPAPPTAPLASSRLAMTPAQLLDQDALILDDVPVDALDANQWAAVDAMVRDRGGSVIVIAGDYAPAQYAGHSLPRGLLPFDGQGTWPQWRAAPGERPLFHFEPAVGADAGLLPDSPPSAADQASGGMYRFFPISSFDARTGSFNGLKRGVKVLLIESESNAAALTEMRLGAGHAFLFGCNETWRWRRGGDLQDRFWRRLVRLASEAPYAVQDGGASLDVERVWVSPGQPIAIRAKSAGASAVSVSIVSAAKGKTHRTVALGAEGDGRFSGSASDLPPGDYRIEMANPKGGAPLGIETRVRADLQPELADLSGDLPYLSGVTDPSGGATLLLTDIRQVPLRMAQGAANQSSLVEQPLWDSFYLFGFVVACLGAEWALRKRLGLS